MKVTDLLEGQKSPEEYKLREKMMSKIEGYFGTLESLAWDKLSTADMTTMYDTLVEKKQIKA